MLRADLILGLLLAGVFGYMLVDLQGMRWQTSVAPGLAASAGLLLAVWHIVTTAGRLWRAAPGAAADAEPPPYDREDVVPIFGFLASVLAVVMFGFAIGGALFVFLSVLGATRGRWLVALICAVPVYPFFALLIDRGLGIVMFDGLLMRWLAS